MKINMYNKVLNKRATIALSNDELNVKVTISNLNKNTSYDLEKNFKTKKDAMFYFYGKTGMLHLGDYNRVLN